MLNDDRIARALDALAPVLDQVTGSVGAAAIASYGIDVSQLHWDMTSISLHGDYPITDEDFPRPRFGHPKDRRPDLKQIQAGVATAADGSVPVFWRPYDGGAAEVSQVVGTMQALRRLAGPRRFLLVGDSKLLSYNNIAAMTAAQGRDLPGPGSQSVRTRAGARRLRPSPRPPRWTSSPPGTPTAPSTTAATTGSYEDTMTITGPLKRDPSDHPAAGLRALLGPRRGRPARPNQETRPRPRRPVPTVPRPGLAALPHPGQGRRPDHHHHPAPPRRRLPAHHHRHRRPTADPPSPGRSTKQRSTPRPPPTAGTHC